MRGVQAKRLRRAAQEKTVGQPERKLIGVRRKGTKAGVMAYLDPNCTRAVYQRLKTMFKREKRA